MGGGEEGAGEAEAVNLYRVRVHEEARRSLEGVPDAAKKQILDLLSVLRDVTFPPARFDARRMEDASSFVKVWIGDYEVEYEIDLEEAVVSVGRITRHSDA
jgi:mRNA-degrading endonuclease RelE of RelBE toxin-antitoxin system